MRYILFCLVMVQLSGCAQSNTSLPQNGSKPIAFPGAEGFGKFATGGRGGDVFIVTNLNDSGPGSLRDAIKKKGPRTITFAVSGTIALESELVINNDDVTIAGQSAPGDGVCIKNYPFRISANNVIVRYMRFRLGDEKSVQGDSFSGARTKNVIIDHCSISWATDECASFYYNEDFTMQWCIISESLNNSVHEKGEHGYGGIWGGVRATFHHNLLAHHTSRLPRFSGSSTTANSKEELVDFRNNVIYNWGHNNTYGGEKGRYNVVNNYYKPGPATPPKKRDRIINPSEPYGKFFIVGNYLDGNGKVSNNNSYGISANHPDSAAVAVPFEVVDINMDESINAYTSVLQKAGASKKRDAIDDRVVEETKTGTATMGTSGIIDSQAQVGGWPTLNTAEEPIDTDKDGMPDAWEKVKGLNPVIGLDGAQFMLSKEYTNLEVYLNAIIEQ